MSGATGDQECPRCHNTLDTYDDWKPHTFTYGKCPYCGYIWWTEIAVISDQELEELRDELREIHDEEMTWPDRDTLDKDRIKEYDVWMTPNYHIDTPDRVVVQFEIAKDDCDICKKALAVLLADAKVTEDYDGKTVRMPHVPDGFALIMRPSRNASNELTGFHLELMEDQS